MNKAWYIIFSWYNIIAVLLLFPYTYYYNIRIHIMRCEYAHHRGSGRDLIYRN